MTQKSPDPTPKAGSAQPASSKPPTNQSRLQVFLRMLRQLGGILLAFIPILINVLRQLGQLMLAFLRWLQQQWAVLLPKIRALLPAPWRTKLPDPVITAVAIGLLALLLWVPITLRSGRSPAIAQTPQSSQTESPTLPAKPVEPPVDLNRIAAIQEQMSEVTAEDVEGLIQAVRVNFLSNRLTVSVSDDWYSLDATERDRLASKLLKRSKKLAFEKLEIIDLEGTLVARSPVVGPNMVMLIGSQDKALLDKTKQTRTATEIGQ